MFDYLEAEAYHKLREEIMTIVDRALEENPGPDVFFSEKMHALSEVLEGMNAVDSALREVIEGEAEKEASYYESELSADESRSNQL